MIDFYYNRGPNPMKVALLLEEASLEYRPLAVDMLRGEQFDAHFERLNPNNKVPVIVDDGTVVFDSNAILLFLAEKHDCFLPADPLARGSLLSWLMFIGTGVGPYAGQAVHFRHYAPDQIDYALQRYLFEAKRHFGVLDKHLVDRAWMVGETYTIVDMAVWGWARNMTYVIGDEAQDDFPRLAALVDTIEVRPAARRAISIGNDHTFKDSFDDEARRSLFRHQRAN